jgi:hypothetical protein
VTKEESVKLRTKAARARELAAACGDEKATANLNSFAKDLEAEADRIDAASRDQDQSKH